MIGIKWVIILVESDNGIGGRPVGIGSVCLDASSISRYLQHVIICIFRTDNSPEYTDAVISIK